MVEWVPRNGSCQCLCPQDESQLACSSLGGSPRSASESHSSFFQTTASALSPGVYEILCVPFNSRISISHSPDSPENKPHWPSKPKILGAHLPSAEPRGWRAPWGGCTPCSLGRTSTIVIILALLSHLPWGLAYALPLLLLPILSYFLLYILSCRRFFSTNLLVVHINNCLVNNFSFGVPVGGGELRVFLFHPLGHFPHVSFRNSLSIFSLFTKRVMLCCWDFTESIDHFGKNE